MVQGGRPHRRARSSLCRSVGEYSPNRSCVHLARPSGAAGRTDMSQTAVSTHEHRAPPLAAAPIPERHHRHRGKLRPRSPRPRLRPRHPRRRPVARLKTADADTPAEPKLGIVATLSREISRWRAAARSLMPSRHARRASRCNSTIGACPNSPSPEVADLCATGRMNYGTWLLPGGPGFRHGRISRRGWNEWPVLGTVTLWPKGR